MKTYALDNSAIIHMASLRERHANSYRFCLTLKENVCPEILQQALENIVARFPTVLAGIRAGQFAYEVVPVRHVPKVIKDTAFLKTMTRKEIEKQAFRVLYKENQISVEVFHSITDGHGAITLLTTLLAEYMKLLKGISAEVGKILLDLEEEPKIEEVRDDFFVFGESGDVIKTESISYQFPVKEGLSEKILAGTYAYDTKTLLHTARTYKVSITTLLATLMLKSVLEVQKNHSPKGNKTVQIMVPINLRNLFPSKTLRNFSLFALVSVKPKDGDKSFEEMLKLVEEQLKKQLNKENMARLMAGYAKIEKLWILKVIPLALKNVVLRGAHYHFGEQKSCITLTNLGVVKFQKEIAPLVEKVEVFLTPRLRSRYNCGIITYGDVCYINFTRLHKEDVLGKTFDRKLQEILLES